MSRECDCGEIRMRRGRCSHSRSGGCSRLRAGSCWSEKRLAVGVQHNGGQHRMGTAASSTALTTEKGTLECPRARVPPPLKEAVSL